MSDSIFAKIIRREIPAKIVHETDSVLAFHDIDPKAPTHILIIPKKPIKDVSSVTPEDREVLGELLLAARAIAEKMGFGDDGFRLVINNGASAGQTVFHLHMHVLAGRSFGWPPG